MAAGSVLTGLGFGFAFVGRQYPITVGTKKFRIDLLFHHFKLHRFVVIELKTTEAHPSHLGQLGFCVGAVDRFLRDPERDARTLGNLIAESRDERPSSSPFSCRTSHSRSAPTRPFHRGYGS
ncbi:PDDEXK nuclease domain-containing protein [Streptomyces sp. NPDC051644]|uniref:PDDEXK nuclease domain-containing protein n=1 Tax=Streptomyces sp. NPDC051644 TaxID=3365666 RepID=UPI00379B9680